MRIRAWLADVGGGSSEVAPLFKGGAQCPISLELGAVSLSERHQKNDPPGVGELAAMAGDASAVLKPLKNFNIARLVATAGTAATLASLVLGLEEYSPDKVNNLVVTRQQLRQQLDRLAALPLARRRNLTGLEPERADIILAGLVILDTMLAITELNRLTAMDAGLLEGILLDSLNRLP
jgi:exopolyphosphatase/guanosine-5'-triphosphate,3'-diphosphate pyrophosphatase